jgi:hypothetical protein
MPRRVFLWKSSNVSEEQVAFIFTDEGKQQNSMKQVESTDTCLTYSSVLKMKVIDFSETSQIFNGLKRRYMSEYRTLHNHRCENLKS